MGAGNSRNRDSQPHPHGRPESALENGAEVLQARCCHFQCLLSSRQEWGLAEADRAQLLSHIHKLQKLADDQRDLLHDVLDAEPEDDEDGTKKFPDPQDYPEPRYGYKAQTLEWVKPGTPIEHMTAVTTRT